MWQELKRWPFLLAALVMIALYASRFLDIRPGDARPLGSAADIEQLSQRDDLNLLFILIDTLRAERLGSYGYERDTSPSLDYLASSGVRLARHLSQSWPRRISLSRIRSGASPTWE